MGLPSRAEVPQCHERNVTRIPSPAIMEATNRSAGWAQDKGALTMDRGLGGHVLTGRSLVGCTTRSMHLQVSSNAAVLGTRQAKASLRIHSHCDSHLLLTEHAQAWPRKAVPDRAYDYASPRNCSARPMDEAKTGPLTHKLLYYPSATLLCVRISANQAQPPQSPG